MIIEMVMKKSKKWLEKSPLNKQRWMRIALFFFFFLEFGGEIVS